MIQKTKRILKWIPILKKRNQKYIGIHIVAEFWHGKVIEDKKKLKEILIKAVLQAKSTPLECVIHKFEPHGITGVVLLSESHMAIHTWPEINYIAIDIFTCGERTLPNKAIEYLKEALKPKKFEIKEIKRGKI